VISGKGFFIAKMSSQGTVFTPTGRDLPGDVQVKLEEAKRELRSSFQVWNYLELEKVHQPFFLDRLDEQERLQFDCDVKSEKIRILDMPIKFPHSVEYKVPKELAKFLSIIQKIASYDVS
jgi:hypothetical protein